MKILFAGTPEFAVPSLQALIESDHDVIGVYSQPDRPAGRGRKLAPSPVKAAALAHDIPVYQPPSLKDALAQQTLASHNADLLVVAAYGLILPKAVLAMPQYGCINVHGSLLPRWRGAAPVQMAIIEGDRETGVTIMQMDEGLDTGDMLHKVSCPIDEQVNSSDLMVRLAQLGGGALMDTLAQLQAGILEPQKQNEAQVTYAHKINKADALIDWRESAGLISRKIRGFNPWPGALTTYGDHAIKIWQASVVSGVAAQKPGTIIAIDKAGIDVATGDGVLRLTVLQWPSKKRQPAEVFAVSRAFEKGATLG
jgi:methionyl-tRNA formyltransferase